MRHQSIRTSAERIALALVLVASTAVQAADRPAAVPARDAFDEAERLYQLGRFEEAITAYERAFALDQQPAFLFNIALAHRRQFEIDGKTEHLRRARELYRNYLRLDPTTSRRAAVERLIEELGARLERAPAPPPITTLALAPPPPAPQPQALVVAPRSPEPQRKSTAVWWIAGAAAVAAAVVLTVVLTRDRRTPTDGPVIDLGGVPK